MPVEIGTVHASEFGFSVYGEATTSADAGAVQHNGAHARRRCHAELLCNQAYVAHHSQRSHDKHSVVCFSFKYFRKTVGHAPLARKTAVLGHNRDMPRYRGIMLVKHHSVAGFESKHGVCDATRTKQLFGDGISVCHARPPADNKRLFKPFKLRRFSQRTYEILQKIALFVKREFFRGRTLRLKNYADFPRFPVAVRYCKRKSLSVLVRPQNNKLSRLRLGGNQRRLDVHKHGGFAQIFFFGDFVHR